MAGALPLGCRYESARSLEDSAHALGWTVSRIEPVRVIPEIGEVMAERSKIFDPSVYLSDLFVEQLRDMAARRLFPIPDLDDLTQLPEGETDGLTGPDELESVDHTSVVVPVSRGGAPWLRDETLLLVEADCRGGQPCPVRYFTDLHAARLPLDLQPHLKLYVGEMPPKVTLQYFEGCPNWQITEGFLDRLIGEGVRASVRFQRIDSHEEAIEQGFRGSPTVLVEGVDPFADDNAPVGLACRLYQTEQGLAGSPTLSDLRQAITAAPQ